MVSLKESLANVLLYLFIILLYLLLFEQTYGGYALIKIMYIARYLGMRFAWMWLSKQDQNEVGKRYITFDQSLLPHKQ